jgi:drug/metabolite transporter (DMT)-like permease
METWLLLAFVAPLLWALVTVIDVYFVDGVYQDEYDGAIIAGVFQSLVWLLVFFGVVGFTFPNPDASMWAFGSGVLWIVYTFFYFRTLFAYNDSVLMQVLGNISVLAVPFFAWFLLGERLEPIHYVGIGIAFVGVTIFSLDRTIAKGKFSDVAPPMILAVGVLSLSMVFGKRAYDLSDDFWSLFLLYCTGAVSVSVALLFSRLREARSRAVRIVRMSRKYFLVFALAESLAVVGTLASQRAISLAPAVSFVAVIESLVPVFAMFLSLISAYFLIKKGRTELGQVYRDQLLGFRTKAFAVALLAIGIYVVS